MTVALYDYIVNTCVFQLRFMLVCAIIQTVSDGFSSVGEKFERRNRRGLDEKCINASFMVLFSSCHFIIVGPGLHADSAVNFSDLHLHEGA